MLAALYGVDQAHASLSCARCSGWSRGRCGKLHQLCRQPNASGNPALARMARGAMPDGTAGNLHALRIRAGQVTDQVVRHARWRPWYKGPAAGGPGDLEYTHRRRMAGKRLRAHSAYLCGRRCCNRLGPVSRNVSRKALSLCCFACVAPHACRRLMPSHLLLTLHRDSCRPKRYELPVVHSIRPQPLHFRRISCRVIAASGRSPEAAWRALLVSALPRCWRRMIEAVVLKVVGTGGAVL